MKIETALKLKRGQCVQCPPDRGDAGFYGKVTSVGAVVDRVHNSEFIWVEVQGPHHKSVWPSNRLGCV